MVEVLERGRNARTGAGESQVSVILAERLPTAPRPARTPSAILDHRRLCQTVAREYARVALFPARVFPWPVGRSHARDLGYPEDSLARLPRLAVESFSGVAYPFGGPRERIGPPGTGETVVDVGAGSGVDALLAADRVGPNGRVIGIELSEELARKATLAARQAKRSNVRFEKGLAEKLPLPDRFADLVLANGVVNLLVADKEGALREIWRVLRPGGRLLLADIAVSRAALRVERSQPERWLTHLAGPIPREELLFLVGEAGFGDLDLEWTVAEEHLESADALPLGARRFILTARKPGD